MRCVAPPRFLQVPYVQGAKLSRPRRLKLPNRMQLDAVISSNAFSNAIMVVIMVNVVLPLRCRAVGFHFNRNHDAVDAYNLGKKRLGVGMC